jgi:lactate permease
MGAMHPERKQALAEIPLFRAVLPYVLVASLLLISRLPGLGLQQWLSGVSFGPESIFGTGIGQRFQPFYLPGFMFLLASLAAYPLHRMRWPEIRESWITALAQLSGAAVALVFALPMVRVFILSGSEYGQYGLASMPITLAETAALLAAGAWPFFAPWIGALGAFAAGSNTVSNLMFSLFQFSTAGRIGADPSVVVAVQAVGGAAGNMITVHNVVAASATVGLVGQEGALIRKSVIPMVYYCILAGALAHLWIYGLGLNLGTMSVLLLGTCLVWAVRSLR